jgi:hypothetical protein
MSMWLRQSTAGQEIQLGKFVDDTDGKTAKTALTIANTDIKLWVEGATSRVNKNSGGATHMDGGYYSAVLDATDSATLGKLEVTVDVAGALSVRREFMVIPAIVFDALVLRSEFLPVDSYEQKFSSATGSLVTKKPDGTTDTAYSPKSVTTDAAALPITGA